MKAVIFARVSSKEQEIEGYSLDAQIDKLQEYAKRKELEVVKEFRITESSTKGERKLFHDALAYVKNTRKKGGERVAVIADKVDRLIRNFKDYPAINQLIEDDIAELHFAGEGSILSKESTSSDKFMWNMRIVMAQSYVDTMKDNVARSRKYKIKQGEICCLAPIGYVNVTKDRAEQSDVIFDPERFMLVRRLFVEYASGIYSIRELTRRAKEHGLRSRAGTPLSQTTINNMLKNRFYIGYATENGKEFEHRYERLIDDEVFYKCQAVMSKHKAKPAVTTKREFIFQGMLTCSKCGCMYSSEIKKEKYIYLRPSKKKGACDCYQINEETILEQVYSIFDSIYYPPELLEQIKEHIKQINREKNEYRDNRLKSLQKELERINQRLDGLIDMLLDKSITQDIYDRKVCECKDRKHEIASELNGLSDADGKFYESLSALICLTSNAGKIFRSSNIEQKRKLMSFLFSNLNVNGCELQYSLRKPFDILVNLPERKEWRE